MPKSKSADFATCQGEGWGLYRAHFDTEWRVGQPLPGSFCWVDLSLASWPTRPWGLKHKVTQVGKYHRAGACALCSLFHVPDHILCLSWGFLCALPNTDALKKAFLSFFGIYFKIFKTATKFAILPKIKVTKFLFHEHFHVVIFYLLNSASNGKNLLFLLHLKSTFFDICI